MFKKNMLTAITALILIWTGFLLIVGISWVIGYYSNALYNMHYDLNSCVSSLSIVGSALGSILMLVAANYLKERENTKRYNIDSIYNSKVGRSPVKRRGAE